MGTVSDKLLYLNETKQQLLNAINGVLYERGEPLLTSDDTFREYARRLFTPLSLFSNGEQGAWYDPSDLTTLLQDAAGTTPVTASGDPVGLMLDKSGNGNHASQGASAYRLTYEQPSAIESSGVSTCLDVLDDAPRTHPYASIGNQVSGFFAVRFDAFNPVNTTANWVISSVVHEIRNIGSWGGQKIPFSIGANGNKVGFGCTSDYLASGAPKKINGVTSMAVGQKYIIGFVVDGTNLTLYLNGQIEATSTSLGTASRSPADGSTNVSSRIASRTRDDNAVADSLIGGIYGGRG